MGDVFKSVNELFFVSQKGQGDDSSSEVDDGDHSEANTAAEVERVRNLVSDEAFRVRFGRMLVFLTLLGTGTIVCLLVYAVLLFQNESNIQGEFDSITDLIKQDFQDRMMGLFEANVELSNFITIEAVKNNESFPYVSVPYFEVYSNDVRARANADLVLYGPLTSDFNDWKNFSMSKADWVNNSLAIFSTLESNSERLIGAPEESSGGEIRTWGEAGNLVPANTLEDKLLPLLHYSPPLEHLGKFQNFDLSSEEVLRSLMSSAANLSEPVFSPFTEAIYRLAYTEEKADEVWGVTAFPVFKTLLKKVEDVVGYVFLSLAWGTTFDNLLPEGVGNIRVSVNNTCGQSAGFDIVRGKAVFSGFQLKYKEVDFYRPKTLHTYIPMSEESQIETGDESFLAGKCAYFLEVRALKDFSNGYGSNFRYAMTLGIAASFAIMGAVFYTFDKQTKLQDKKMVEYAAQSNTVLASLFPSAVRDRMFNKNEIKVTDEDARGFVPSVEGGSTTNAGSTALTDTIIADLYPETTILFADIAGFTAWSSMQEPKQVFILLETIFKSFDKIAHRRRVFKVETVGDCYVAAVGVPNSRREHATVMCRFARDCMYKMWDLTEELEMTLGPESGDLAMRMGIHSGPVTAGILRGERARFQLFGDTVNTASRIESTGRPNCIHVSSETAKLLIAAGKTEWITPREDKVKAKGKGELKTYWLQLGPASSRGGGTNSMTSGSISGDQSLGESLDDDAHDAVGVLEEKAREQKYNRLVEWNVDLLTKLLRQIAGRRVASTENRSVKVLSLLPEPGCKLIDEVKEVVSLRRNSTVEKSALKELDPEAVEQLRYFVSSVCAMYRKNPFHNFEHASHVVMSVTKLLARIIEDKTDESRKDLRDPLTLFACAFSALIHDLDHPGVPNTQLVNENTDLAQFYEGKSIAEQNSLELAFGLLMDKQFEVLRRAIYSDEEEMQIFRQLVINSVMATDIVDKDLKALRNARWEKVFSTSTVEEGHLIDSVHRKATIVIEHLIQASDVAHTMQHWHVYRKWNERFFRECYAAYKAGRAKENPALTWYEGELGFFDYYIIPLAKKLKNCGVFGVSSDEYLNYASKNREEWEAKGREVVAELLENEEHEKPGLLTKMASVKNIAH